MQRPALAGFARLRGPLMGDVSRQHSMDAQVLQELVWIRWLLTAVVALVVLLLLLVAWFTAQAIAAQDQMKGTFYDRANALLNRGELRELLVMCDERVLEYPGDAMAYWLMANAHYRLNNLNRALICYKKTDELQPGWSIGPMIAEIEEKIARSAKSPDLKVVSPTPLHNPTPGSEGHPRGVDG